MQLAFAREMDPPLLECPWCRSTRLKSHDFDFTGIHISRCLSCGVQFMNPQFSDRHLRRLYADYTNFEGPESTSKLVPRTLRKAKSLELLGQFKDGGRFLSMGCGDGVELWIAEAYGWQAEGYEVDGQVAARAARRYGIPVHSEDFFKLHAQTEPFDCIYLDQVIEHLKRPQDYLCEIQRLLKPGGILFLGCPNIGSVANRWKTSMGKLGLKRRRGRHYGTFHHLFYYTPQVLSRLLQQFHGLEVLRIQGEPPTQMKLRWLEAAWGRLYRALPNCDSSIQIVARKPAVESTILPTSAWNTLQAGKSPDSTSNRPSREAA